jgi:hypothetical protein
VTARRRDGETGIFDWSALLVALAVGATLVTHCVGVANHPTVSKDGIPVGMYFLMGSVALLAAAGDVRMLVRGGVFGAHRIAWHLGACALRCSTPQGPYSWDSTSIPCFLAENHRTFCPGYPATDIDDFLAIPSSLHKYIQEKVDAARRQCLLLTDPGTLIDKDCNVHHEFLKPL